METARILLDIVEIWGWIGLGVAAAFLLFGIERIDPSAERSYAFRALLIPGLIVLWPLVLVRWYSLEREKIRKRNDAAQTP